jgi:hypothetical protein
VGCLEAGLEVFVGTFLEVLLEVFSLEVFSLEVFSLEVFLGAFWTPGDLRGQDQKARVQEPSNGFELQMALRVKQAWDAKPS